MSALDVLSAGAAESVLRRVADEQGFALRGHFGPVGINRDRLLAGEACDIVVLTDAMIEGLISSGHVAPGTAVALGRVDTALAVAAGAPKPKVADAEALRGVLLAATAIHIPDPAKATAGAHVARVIGALGIADAVGSRLKIASGGAAAMAALAASGDVRAIGATQATEIKATPGVALVGPLPWPHGLSTVYTAAIAGRATRAEAARALLDALASGAATSVIADAGFTPV